MDKNEYIKEMVRRNRTDVEKLYFLHPEKLKMVEEFFVNSKTAYRIRKDDPSKRTLQAMYYLIKPIRRELYSFFETFYSNKDDTRKELNFIS